jgi:hypothetical protein
MQLIAGRSGQEYNQRKGRHGAFWEDRYHATAIEINEHLQRCLVYIDLNMVRARVVTHPCNWTHSGYREIQKPRKRYGIIDLRELSSLCGFGDVATFQQAHRGWVDDSLARKAMAQRRSAVRSDRGRQFKFVERCRTNSDTKRHIAKSLKVAVHMSSGSRLKVMGPILAVKMRS